MARYPDSITPPADETVEISTLTPDPRNARRHPDRNLAVLEASLREVGAARSIVVDEAGVVLAGNATVEAAGRAGITSVRVVDADGTELVAVRRSGLTPEQKTRLALLDNRAAELAGWDAGVLAALAADTDLAGLWDDDELAAILAHASPPDIEFPAYDETAADGVAYATCPECGHRFPT